jgi:hypothetical protein
MNMLGIRLLESTSPVTAIKRAGKETGIRIVEPLPRCVAGARRDMIRSRPMTRVTRWALGTVVALVPLGIVLPSIAQRAGEPRQGSTDLEQARQMAQLVEQGQLNLRDATALAEKHCKGTALEATCDFQGGPDAAPERGGPDAAPPKDGAGPRLVYEINCFAKDKIQAVRVDGLEKKVIGMEQCEALKGGGDDRP